MNKMMLTGVALGALLLSGCGGSSSSGESARDILLGKTLYTVDENLNEPRGYYKDIYGESTITETEHAEDGTQLFQPFTLQLSYNNKNIVVSVGSESIVCGVEKSSTGVIFDCNDGRKFQQWYKISDILR